MHSGRLSVTRQGVTPTGFCGVTRHTPTPFAGVCLCVVVLYCMSCCMVRSARGVTYEGRERPHTPAPTPSPSPPAPSRGC
jgi:hypothetical protein